MEKHITTGNTKTLNMENKTALGGLGDQTGTRKGSQSESKHMPKSGMRKDLGKDLAQGWRKDGARTAQGCARTSQGLGTYCLSERILRKAPR